MKTSECKIIFPTRAPSHQTSLFECPVQTLFILQTQDYFLFINNKGMFKIKSEPKLLTRTSQTSCRSLYDVFMVS